jgi:hypothetical protein
MRTLRVVSGLLLCLTSMSSLAEPDTFGLGNGQHGPLRVMKADTAINTATALTSTAAAGATQLAVGDVTGFAAGELVLIIQMFAEGTAPEPGTVGPLELNPTSAGRWEFARLESVSPGTLAFKAPLVSGFTAPGSQVVRVPEYTSVHVQPSFSLMAPPWNGSSGGVLAFLATDFVLNQGLISAEGAGFQGGSFKGISTRPTGCTQLSQSEATGGARKGEGLYRLAAGAPTHGYGALGNGAGGGICEDSGGGGGGHGGAGGKGGFTTTTDGARDVGGRGGLALRYTPLNRLMFGGGGGAGAGSAQGQGGGTGSSGGAGGGIIYIRSRDFQGSQGRVSANGVSAASSVKGGAGGGGAGGHVTLRVEGRIDCASIEANGGNGGDNTDTQAHGPGGGGGGGVVLLQGSPIGCTASTLPGQAGHVTGAGGGHHGATPMDDSPPELQGSITVVDETLATPAAPAWVMPAEGERTALRPPLEGTAVAGSTVRIFLDGALLGSVEASATGGFTYPLIKDLALGPHELSAVAERLGLRGAPSGPRAFIVVSPEPLDLKVGCGCGVGLGAGGGWLALWGLLLARARRARRAAGPGSPPGAGAAG